MQARTVGSFKSKRTRKFPSRNVVEISGPVIADKENMQAKLQHLNCVDISPTSEPKHSPTSAEYWTEDANADNTQLASESNLQGSHLITTSVDSPQNENNSTSLPLSPVAEAATPGRPGNVRRNHSDTNLMEIFILPQDYKPGSFPKILQNGYIEAPEGYNFSHKADSFSQSQTNHYNTFSGSDTKVTQHRHRRRGSHDSNMHAHRVSLYDNVPDTFPGTADDSDDLAAAQQDLDLILHDLFQNINGLNEAISAELEAESGKQQTVDVEVECSTVDKQQPQQPSESEDQDAEPGPDGSTSSPSSSHHSLDQDHVELSPDDSVDIGSRERRDSGVGSSLTRESSDNTRRRIRWHSFQKSHRPSLGSRDFQISGLSVCQLMMLRKLSLLKLTAIMEKYSPTNRTGWNWLIPRIRKRPKVPDFSDKKVFGVPLYVILQRTGQPLPQCILYAMRYLRKTASDSLGIFRKSGVRSRIQKMRNDLEEDPESVNFEELQAFDVADLLKQYFRELPECLLTNKLSDTFTSIFTHVPQSLQLEAIQAAIVLLPDENREVLQSLLLFLSDISHDAKEHQMTASNLAVCFAPSLFNMCGLRPNQGSPSPRRNRRNAGVPDSRELMEQKAAHECLTSLIMESKKIFMISPDVHSRLLHSCKDLEPMPLDSFYRKVNHLGLDHKTFGEECIQTLLKECHEKNRGWVQAFSTKAVDVAYKKGDDTYPLREWKCVVEVEAPPVEVLNRILNERHIWDEDLLTWNLVQKLDKHADVFQYTCNSMAPHPVRQYIALRYWRKDLVKGACALVSTSVDHPDLQEIQGVRACLLESYFLAEPCGSGRSRLSHITRDDTRGRCAEWYNKAYGHICANYMSHIRDSFQQCTEGPETKV